MTKRLQHWLSWYLALCFAFAGMVAVSPVLHQVVEHGGHSSAHSHFGGSRKQQVAAEHHPVASDATWVSKSGCDIRPNHPIFRHRHGIRLSDVAKLWTSFQGLVERTAHATSEGDPDGATPEHEHHSLPQLVGSGLLESPVEFPLFHVVSAPRLVRSEFAEIIFHPQDWNAQTASRGPPLPIS